MRNDWAALSLVNYAELVYFREPSHPTTDWTGLQTRPPLINTKDETENQNSLDRRKNISLFSEFLVPGGLNYITCFTFKNLQSINIPDESDLFHKKLY